MPTENLNIPEVYVGCLKVLYDNQGSSPSDQSVFDGLRKVELDLQNIDSPTLAREPKRNLFRNSGQYWKATGLLEKTNGGIELTELGVSYATDKITRSEFSSYTIKSLEFPNEDIDSDAVATAWNANQTRIKPLELILKIITSLYLIDNDKGYLTAEELVKVVIPLSGNNCSLEDITIAINDYRNTPSLFLNTWSADERSNDKRIARELLLFLYHYDFLGIRNTTDPSKRTINLTQEFYIFPEQIDAITVLLELDISNLPDISSTTPTPVEVAIEIDDKTQVIDAARERKLVEVLARPNQTKFRKNVLESGGTTCILSGVTIKEALQACHIIPVKNKGSDDQSNGFILRADLHTLYDKGHIRIHVDGTIFLSDYLRKDDYYKNSIPSEIEIPTYVSIEAIRMRNEYSM
jgi:hypothetical protein